MSSPYRGDPGQARTAASRFRKSASVPSAGPIGDRAKSRTSIPRVEAAGLSGWLTRSRRRADSNSRLMALQASAFPLCHGVEIGWGRTVRTSNLSASEARMLPITLAPSGSLREIRTPIQGFKGPGPAVRRRGNGQGGKNRTSDSAFQVRKYAIYLRPVFWSTPGESNPHFQLSCYGSAAS